MRNFTIFAIITLITFFFVSCAQLTKEEKEKNRINSDIIAMLKAESNVERIKIHRVTAKDPTTHSGKLVASAIKKGFLSAGPPIKGRNDGRYWVNTGSAPAVVTKYTIFATIMDNVDFKLISDPVVTILGSRTSIFIEYEYKGKLNKFGVFLKKEGADVASEGTGVLLMKKTGDSEWRIVS